MQQSDLEALIRTFSQSSGNAQTAAQLQEFMRSPAGAQFIQQMQHSRSLSDAAEYARAGDMEHAKRAVQQLMRTPEGAQLAAQLRSFLKR